MISAIHRPYKTPISGGGKIYIQSVHSDYNDSGIQNVYLRGGITLTSIRSCNAQSPTGKFFTHSGTVISGTTSNILCDLGSDVVTGSGPQAYYYTQGLSNGNTRFSHRTLTFTSGTLIGESYYIDMAQLNSTSPRLWPLTSFSTAPSASDSFILSAQHTLLDVYHVDSLSVETLIYSAPKLESVSINQQISDGDYLSIRNGVPNSDARQHQFQALAFFELGYE